MSKLDTAAALEMILVPATKVSGSALLNGTNNVVRIFNNMNDTKGISRLAIGAVSESRPVVDFWKLVRTVLLTTY